MLAARQPVAYNKNLQGAISRSNRSIGPSQALILACQQEIDMMELKKRYLVDEDGNRLGVVLDIKDYRRLLEELEELETLRTYDAAKASGDQAIPFEEAVAEIESCLA